MQEMPRPIIEDHSNVFVWSTCDARKKQIGKQPANTSAKINNCFTPKESATSVGNFSLLQDISADVFHFRQSHSHPQPTRAKSSDAEIPDRSGIIRAASMTRHPFLRR
jgi:hypothetical protein